MIVEQARLKIQLLATYVALGLDAGEYKILAFLVLRSALFVRFSFSPKDLCAQRMALLFSPKGWE